MTTTIDITKIDPDAIRVIQRLIRAQHEAYLVGGCVRDLLLQRRPKDFDVATDATPNILRRLFRNCRIIGRRFRLAHIFFGQKIIETSTFRDAPRESEGAPSRDGQPAESSDLLIRRDNVFGTAEQDARRRDFTVNGLFFDVEKQIVIDHVNGLPDIEARLVRTIGDPDIRFREDPVRILRAVKFAARCDLSIEDNTRRSMISHAAEIEKSAKARVSEEFFRLLRAGAAHRSMELLVEFGLLGILLPDFDAWLRRGSSEDPAIADLWNTLRVLDATTTKLDIQPSNAAILSALVLPRMVSALSGGAKGSTDMLLSELMAPLIVPLRVSRRDSDNTRQLLGLLRRILPGIGDPGAARDLHIQGRDLRADAYFIAHLLHALGQLPEDALTAFELRAPVTSEPGPPKPITRTGMAPQLPTGLSPIPSLPGHLQPTACIPFLGNGCFGSVLSGPFALSTD